MNGNGRFKMTAGESQNVEEIIKMIQATGQMSELVFEKMMLKLTSGGITAVLKLLTPAQRDAYHRFFRAKYIAVQA
ncbi:MAG: hypothetical protein AAB358_00950 [Patescibacteria group bacterium]